MGKTKQQVLDSILEQVSAFEISDDTPIDRDWLSAKVDDIREKLITEEYMQLGTIDDSYFEMDCCIPVSCADLAECAVSGISFSSGEKVFYFDVPPLITGLGQKAIKSAFLALPGLMEMKSIYQKSLMGFNSMDGLRWTKNEMGFTQIGSKGYIRNLPSEGVRFICLVVAKRTPGSDCEGTVETSEYPVKDYHRLEYIARQEVANAYAFSPDRLNDAAPAMMRAKQPKQEEE